MLQGVHATSKAHLATVPMTSAQCFHVAAQMPVKLEDHGFTIDLHFQLGHKMIFQR